MGERERERERERINWAEGVVEALIQVSGNHVYGDCGRDRGHHRPQFLLCLFVRLRDWLKEAMTINKSLSTLWCLNNYLHLFITM
ncbi:hypothetical protein CRG98_026218 [Punica granatum]|uniref:Uncharacterized protein n=1 Tax=Punica granatum TaxID=22663 RepID=A0A2I0JAV6_PUNGR|nr:hypothetical protein CRG98_026218 [Punica granatum]